ncbi:interferon alpha-inducible protein 27%2C mitochondrial-like [Xyrichtys novacula]|uniref:Interferon alpha-inducible protein 27, mitochondrial-like n=1 Tax=Xyrichtys novacula TaxID=13765 RepID=A0AAV1GIH3_XYRNO|nr:interferon alpha-inducible protein 27%2C mitochondrial-like [Xyrichtys novacula]
MAGFCDYLLFSALVDICNDIYDAREGICKGAVIGAGGAVTLTFTPALLALFGFTSAGIAAGSIAAKLMSYFAVWNGGGLAAGSLVSFLQSLGATGVTGTAAGVVGTFGGWLGWLLSYICEPTPNPDPKPRPMCYCHLSLVPTGRKIYPEKVYSKTKLLIFFKNVRHTYTTVNSIK